MAGSDTERREVKMATLVDLEAMATLEEHMEKETLVDYKVEARTEEVMIHKLVQNVFTLYVHQQSSKDACKL